MQEKGVAIREGQVLSLPDEGTFRKEIEAVNRFQAIVHANLIKDQDYGVIPGTQKPTLLKPGAEKVAKLLGLADHYVILNQTEDWNKPFFRYLIKCSLVNVLQDTTTSEGLGECNSYESRYRWRWLSERDLPAGVDKIRLVSQERHSKAGGKWKVYRFENEDIFSQVNTILKMAKKRALVDAVLSAGRLSNIFTQDMEDIPPLAEEKAPEAQTSTPASGKKQGISPAASAKVGETDPLAATDEQQAQNTGQGDNALITDEDIAQLGVEMGRAGWDNIRLQKYVKDKEWTAKSLKALTKAQLEETIRDIVADSVE